MFYRRKILLALVELLGGSLLERDGHLLSFLFCKQRGKQFYDFFPTSNGPYSLVLHQDKSRLAALGFLSSHQDFQLGSNQSQLNHLTAKDRAALSVFVSEIGDMRGDELLHLISLEVPSAATRSQLALELAVQERAESVGCVESAEQRCLFTLGYEGLSIDAYLDMLLAHHVSTVIDVRKNPLSRKYGFSKKQFINATKVAGINYIHLPDLGVPSPLRRHLDTASAYKQLFHYYETDILPEHGEALEQLKEVLHNDERIVLTCFEADPVCCHRHKITEYLANDPCFLVPIVHLYPSQNHMVSSISSHKGKAPCGLSAENAVYSLS